MGFLEKIEILINHYLMLLGEVFHKLVVKVTPPSVQRIYLKVSSFISRFIAYLRGFPEKFINYCFRFFKIGKEKVKTFPIKNKISEWQQIVQDEARKRRDSGFFGKLFQPLFILVSYIRQWTNSLSPVQIVLLIIFTIASFFSSFIIFDSSRKIALLENTTARSPASIDDEKVKRPVYYKKQTRDFSIMAIKIPVYFADINEYRSIMVDFSIIMSNRSSKNYLAANEQLLRDYLIMNIEPTIAAFNLQTEGKEIIREKIKQEVTAFLQENNIEGFAQEVKITYLLGH
ncbi:MAG: hypothetical protein ACOVP4_01585 [Bacteriovoracaceae bacterium]